MSKHTELPKLAVGYMDQGLGHGHYAVIVEETGCRLDISSATKDVPELIVQACNSHEGLLKACTQAHDALLALHVCDQDRPFADKTRTLLKAAIAKATD